MKPDQPTGLDYYPLLQPGERFPVNDPNYPPRLLPRANNRLEFFQGILEGIAHIEKQGYELLAAAGRSPTQADHLHRRRRRRMNPGGKSARDLLGVPVTRATQSQAAYGAALLALQGSG